MLEVLPLDLLEKVCTFLRELPELDLVSVSLKKTLFDCSVSLHICNHEEVSAANWLKFVDAISRKHSRISALTFENCNVTTYAITQLVTRPACQHLDSITLVECRSVSSDAVLAQQLASMSSVALSRCSRMLKKSDTMMLTEVARFANNHTRSLVLEGIIHEHPSGLIIQANPLFERGFETLEVLALTNSVIFDWHFLRNLPNLKYLFIGGVEMHSLSNFLEHLTASFGRESQPKSKLRLIEITFQPLVTTPPPVGRTGATNAAAAAAAEQNEDEAIETEEQLRAALRDRLAPTVEIISFSTAKHILNAEKIIHRVFSELSDEKKSTSSKAAASLDPFGSLDDDDDDFVPDEEAVNDDLSSFLHDPSLLSLDEDNWGQDDDIDHGMPQMDETGSESDSKTDLPSPDLDFSNLSRATSVASTGANPNGFSTSVGARTSNGKLCEYLRGVMRFAVNSRNGKWRQTTLQKRLHPIQVEPDLQVVKTLVNFGVELDSMDYRGSTALHRAADANFRSVAQYLLTKGANPVCINQRRETPLVIAIMRRHIDLCKDIIESVPNPAEVFNSEHLQKQSYRKHWTPVKAACLKRDLGLLEFMISHGLTIEGEPNFSSALHFCCSNLSPVHHGTQDWPEGIELLLRHLSSAAVRLPDEEDPCRRELRLRHNRWPEGVELLLRHLSPAALRCPDERSRTPLALAKASRFQRIVQLLTEAPRVMAAKQQQQQATSARSQHSSPRRQQQQAQQHRRNNPRRQRFSGNLQNQRFPNAKFPPHTPSQPQFARNNGALPQHMSPLSGRNTARSDYRSYDSPRSPFRAPNDARGGGRQSDARTQSGGRRNQARRQHNDRNDQRHFDDNEESKAPSQQAQSRSGGRSSRFAASKSPPSRGNSQSRFGGRSSQAAESTRSPPPSSSSESRQPDHRPRASTASSSHRSATGLENAFASLSLDDDRGDGDAAASSRAPPDHNEQTGTSGPQPSSPSLGGRGRGGRGGRRRNRRKGNKNKRGGSQQQSWRRKDAS